MGLTLIQVEYNTIETQLCHFGFLHHLVGKLAFGFLRSIRNGPFLLAFLGCVVNDRGILNQSRVLFDIVIGKSLLAVAVLAT